MRTLKMVAVAGALLLIAGAAFAANGDTINIGGQVPLTLTLVVDTTGLNSDNLTLTNAGPAADVKVTIATLDISTNNTLGWQLWVFSATANGADSAMVNADGDRIPYVIEYDGTGGLPAVTIPVAGLMLSDDATNAVETDGPLAITYSQAPDHPAGYYSDQLAIVLRAR
jgi:hypothetical protein